MGNRMKAKGLQKLRWYCQLCGKQCRDENGFKCHQHSEGHKRMMMVFGESPGKFIDGYSEIFEKNFLEQLKISHPFGCIHANEFYQGVIKDKHHIHMNSTRWLTLTEFVKHLGRTGKCSVQDTEKGWYITLLRPDTNTTNEKKNKIKKEKVLEDLERHKFREIAAQVH